MRRNHDEVFPDLEQHCSNITDWARFVVKPDTQNTDHYDWAIFVGKPDTISVVTMIAAQDY